MYSPYSTLGGARENKRGWLRPLNDINTGKILILTAINHGKYREFYVGILQGILPAGEP